MVMWGGGGGWDKNVDFKLSTKLQLIFLRPDKDGSSEKVLLLTNRTGCCRPSRSRVDRGQWKKNMPCSAFKALEGNPKFGLLSSALGLAIV